MPRELEKRVRQARAKSKVKNSYAVCRARHQTKLGERPK